MKDLQPLLVDIPQCLEGTRIVVRPFTDQDAEDLHEAIQESREHVRPWLPWWNAHESLEDTLAFVRRSNAEIQLRDSFNMGIFDRQAGRLLGGIGLHSRGWDIPAFEIGYWIRKSEEGRGYITEATLLVTSLAFDQFGAERVIIQCDRRNTRSMRVPERLGYVNEGCLRNARLGTDGLPFDIVLFSMTPEDYERARSTW